MRTAVLVIALVASACAARPPFSSTTRDVAVERYVHGDSFDQVAHMLQLPDRDSARAAVHAYRVR